MFISVISTLVSSQDFHPGYWLLTGAFVALLFRICSVSVNDYRNGERHVFNKRLEKVLKGHLKFAISVVYSHPPQMAEEPRISDAMCEVCNYLSKSTIHIIILGCWTSKKSC